MADEFDVSFSAHMVEHGTIFHEIPSRRVVDQMADHIEREVAREGENMVHRSLHEVLRHPTGYYESRVTVHASGTGVEIDGDNVIYGPWLEGVGSRNETTRFKGYFTFRRVGQMLEAKAQRIADRIADREARRLE